MNGRELARALRSRGVRLWLEHARSGACVAFDAPEGAVTLELRTVAATLRDELLDVVASAEERAAILVHEAGLDGPTAEHLGWLETLAPTLDPAPARPGREPRPTRQNAARSL